LLEGRSLEDILKNEKNTPLEKRLDIVAQVCRGLNYAHARGVVHRDVKPAMVTNDGVAKIVDFGIARLADQKLTQTGHVLGTVSYMSPEQLLGKTLDGRSDIFAVGVMLFEALTSVLPFAAEDTGSAVTNILYRQPPSLSNFLANYPRELDDLLKKCLAKEPGERFQVAGELADSLSRIQQEVQRWQTAPTLIRYPALAADPAGFSVPTPPVLPPLESPKRRRNIIIAVAVASLVLVGGVGLRMLHTGADSEPAEKDSGRSPQSTPAPEQSVRDAVATWVIAFRSKDANRLAQSYAPTVEKYFLKENQSRAQILGNIESTFARMSDIRRYEVDAVSIEMLPTRNYSGASRAAATFHKTW
jgi:serine/threonine protein kinase